MEDFKKDFVPYDRALRLKLLGFNEFTQFHISMDNELNTISESAFSMFQYNMEPNEDDTDSLVAAPTFSQAFRWFRKEHELTWEHSFDDSQIQLYIGEIAYPDNCLDFFKAIEVKYDGYNKAFEEAELACLEKLIEIVESK